MKERCDTCFEPLLYERDGQTYSREIMVEIRGVYDGGLLMLCPFCNTYRNRFEPGHWLYDRAQVRLEKIREAQIDHNCEGNL